MLKILGTFMNKIVNSQRGNVFFALFGAVAFIGVLGAATMSFMKGPLKTSVTLSRMSVYARVFPRLCSRASQKTP